MGNLNIVDTLVSSIRWKIINADSATYDYKTVIYNAKSGTLEIEWRSTGSFSGINYARIDMFQPNTTYDFSLYRTSKGGTSWGTAIDTATATTEAIVEPTDANYFATYLPNVQNQFVYENGSLKGEANSCVANSLSLVMDILSYHNRSGSPTNNYFSPSYIYGNRTRQTSLTSELDGMFSDKTIEQLNIDGVPVWSRIPENDDGYKTFPDNRFLTSNYVADVGYGAAGQGAKPMFDGRSTTLDYQAKVNTMSFPINHTFSFSDSYEVTYDYCSFYNSQQIATWVQNNKFAHISFAVADNFYNVSSSGIVPEPDTYVGSSHAMVIIGWITINSKKYWICQNSWGTSWGDGGRCYLPMDWAANSNTRESNYYGNWVNRTHSATYVAPSLPITPSAPVGDTIPRIDSGLNITWNPSIDSDTYDVRYIEGANTYYQYGVNRNTTTLTSLLYGTGYSLSVRGVNYLGTSAWSSSNTLTTAPKTPTITGSSLDAPNNRVSITIGGMEGNYSFFRIWYRNITNNDIWDYLQVNTIGSYWVEGLILGKEYEFKVSSFITVSSVDIESRNSVGNIGYSSSVFYTISARPNNWAWSYNIASGQDVYSVANKTINIMLATEWNNFTARINEFRVYKSLSNYSFTTISSGNNVTKEIINEALNAIRDLNAHFTGGNILIPNRVTGDNILEANIYINMRNCLNSIT